MDQLARLLAASEEAARRPNEHVFIHSIRSAAATEARSFGAVTRKDRYGFGGGWCGYDYFNKEGVMVMQSMSASGNPS